MESDLTRSTLHVIDMQEVAMGAMREPSLLLAERVNWRVAPGDYWAVAGLQGSGKSDFLMTVAGLVPPVAGSYRLFGEQMPIFDEERLKTRLRMGLVFGGGQLFNQLTVAENVALPALYHEDLAPLQAESKLQRWLEAMELTPWATRMPSSLGQNWKKRVGLARALVLQPELLLVDDALGGLDPRHTNWWLAFLDALSQGHPLLEGRPVTVVMTTADLRPWKGHARQFAALKNRKFTLLGSWSQLENVTDESVQELLPT